MIGHINFQILCWGFSFKKCWFTQRLGSNLPFLSWRGESLSFSFVFFCLFCHSGPPVSFLRGVMITSGVPVPWRHPAMLVPLGCDVRTFSLYPTKPARAPSGLDSWVSLSQGGNSDHLFPWAWDTMITSHFVHVCLVCLNSVFISGKEQSRSCCHCLCDTGSVLVKALVTPMLSAINTTALPCIWTSACL